MNNATFGSIAKNTLKGLAIHALALAVQGSMSVSSLALTGVGVSGDTFTLGEDIYELLQVNTDTTVNTANGELNSTKTGVVEITLANQSVGRVLRVEDEFLLVVRADSASCAVLRGFAGSTVAAHADAVDIFGTAAAGTAGTKPVPFGATATNTTVAPLIALAVTYHAAGYYEGVGGGAALLRKSKLDVEAVSAGSGVVMFLIAGGGNPAPDVAETLTNGTITAFTAGSEVASLVKCEEVYTVTAGDVTAGTVRFGLPFAAKFATAQVYTAAGALKAWDGAVVLAAGGRVIEVGNGGVTDWAATDVILMTARG